MKSFLICDYTASFYVSVYVCVGGWQLKETSALSGEVTGYLNESLKTVEIGLWEVRGDVPLVCGKSCVQEK